MKVIINSVADIEAAAEKAGMNLTRMRFFLNTDKQEPKCFGIFQDEDGDWVVYKNKSDGSRAVRYKGPDETEAARIIWDKINDEFEMRKANGTLKKKGGLSKAKAVFYAIIAIIFAALCIVGIHDRFFGPKRGYYSYNDDIYYHGPSYWYVLEDDTWARTTELADSGDYYVGETYTFVDPALSFENSEYYDDEYSDDGGEYENDYDDYDYDTWDAGDTDWDTDW